MNQPTIAVIHTSPATVELFARLLGEQLPQARVMNTLDDSVLPELNANGGDIAVIVPRWRQYAHNAVQGGANVILNACSSIGELCANVERELGVPVIRVDAAMAREAVDRAQVISVVATLQSTLRPSRELLEATAKELDREVEVVGLLVDGAYDALMAGDREDHDERVAQALAQATTYAQVVVLAQASMARVLPRLTPAQQAQCLMSPPLAVGSVVEAVRLLEAEENSARAGA